MLYATDFSKASRKALGYIKGLKGAGLKEVVLLHVIDLENLLDELKSANTALVNLNEEKFKALTKACSNLEIWLHNLRKIEEEARRELEEIEKELRVEGFEVKSVVSVGKPFVEIVHLAKEEDVSAIVVGSHGKGVVRLTLLGSCSEGVVRHATKPVLVVK